MKFKGDYERVNCAGQGCPDKDTCKRYKLTRPITRLNTEDESNLEYEWASFDLERELFGREPCPHRIHFNPNYKPRKGRDVPT